MELRGYLINDPKEVLRIIDDIFDGSELSGEDDDDSNPDCNETYEQEISHDDSDPDENEIPS